MRRITLVPLLAAALAGCGDRSLVLTVDILSFLDPGETSTSYGPVPPGVPATTVELASKDVNLLQGIEDVTEITAASLRVGASFDNASGDASAMLYLHLAPGDSASPFAAAPVASIPVVLTAGQVTNVAAEVTSSPSLAAALTSDRAMVGVRITFDTTGSATPLSGTETITELLATVVTKKKL